MARFVKLHVAKALTSTSAQSWIKSRIERIDASACVSLYPMLIAIACFCSIIQNMGADISAEFYNIGHILVAHPNNTLFLNKTLFSICKLQSITTTASTLTTKHRMMRSIAADARMARTVAYALPTLRSMKRFENVRKLFITALRKKESAVIVSLPLLRVMSTQRRNAFRLCEIMG